MKFEDWAKLNPDKTYNDYQNEQPPPRTGMSTTNVIVIVIIAVFITWLGIHFFNQNERLNMPVSERPIYSENDVQEKVQKERAKQTFLRSWKRLLQSKHEGGTFPGLTGLKDMTIKVRNDTDILIDEITVLVKVKAGLFKGRVCHTGILTFNNISAHDESSTLFSHLECGRDVETEIVGFKCNELDLNVRQ